MARTATTAAAPRAPPCSCSCSWSPPAGKLQVRLEPWEPKGEKGDEGWAPIGGIPLTEPVVPAAAPMVSASVPMVLAEETVITELRCQCLQTLQGIHPRNIQSVKVTSPGPHCDRTEVIATLKNGQKVCLNPASPLVKKILDKMLNKGSSN
ncbi:PREDICTED: growth-regulated protein homolog gamma-like [Myotis brandtii]|uniref:growth-regulated protein homolog gamma-like n=1 Tax=Myotis brandtii TaxID=109478 RepID=UPI000703E5D9|nr:PREDICTED: growth-regulated protein homolog gamma-like [Myotis brandtii]